MTQEKNVGKSDEETRKTTIKKVKTATAETRATTASPEFTVHGTVFSPDRAGVGGLSVTVVDKNVGKDIVLGSAVTDEHGSYTVRFSLPEGSRKIQTKPDLQACAYSGKTLIGASEVRYNAGQSETLDIWLPEGLAGIASEYETLTSAIAVHYTGALGGLKENDTCQDITYLANKTGWDARAVALAALADQFSRHVVADKESSEASAIHPALYYSLFRAGHAANPDTLYRIDIDAVRKTWEQAIDKGVIPSDIRETLPGALETFKTLSAQKILTGPAFIGTSSMQEMLAVSGLAGTKEQKKYADLLVQHRTDMKKFWGAVNEAFPKEAARLKIDAKLGYLTINNAKLVRTLHDVAGSADPVRGKSGISDMVDLAFQGYHDQEKWNELLQKNAEIPVPNEIPGDNAATRRTNYSRYLAALVRLSYPTASVAEMVGRNYLDLKAPAGISEQVTAFLKEHQDAFQISTQPVEQYIRRKGIEVPGEVVTQVKRLQRVYQITQNDQSMAVLLSKGVDSAYNVVHHTRAQFVGIYAKDLGSESAAAKVYERAVQLHNYVLITAMSYLTAKKAVPLGEDLTGSAGHSQYINPAPSGQEDPDNSDIIAYSTLETLFGSMDFCTCEHCRSVLSPAAYLVDLLHFLDVNPNPGNPQSKNPLTELFVRRPDIQHLPLTCENTNVVLPYIDIVNEALEYFVANSARSHPPSNPVDGYTGHDTGSTESADLLASPRFSNNTAYDILRASDTIPNDSAKLYFPPPLPFHQPLETLRRYFMKFEVPLSAAMEVLLVDNVLDPSDPSRYGWRDILLEDAGISRPEYPILTDHTTVPLWRMYGFMPGTPENSAIEELSGVKRFSHRIGISYNDIVILLRTKFINPDCDLIPKLERLKVSFATLDALYNGTITDAEFNALLPTGAGAIDPREFNGTASDSNYAQVIRNWLKTRDSDNVEYFTRISRIITLMDPYADPENPPDFNKYEFRYSLFNSSCKINTVDFVRILRFIRLLKKTGWSIEQTDAALCALYPNDKLPKNDTVAEDLQLLDDGFAVFLPRLGVLMRTMKELNLTPKKDLLSLLTCWSTINTHGTSSLYRHLFLNPSILLQDTVFTDNGYGEYLTDPSAKIQAYKEALRAAFSLTDKEYSAILDAVGFNTETPLTLENVSQVYRHGYLARALKLSVPEFLELISLPGLDPFTDTDPTKPGILLLAALVKAMTEQSIKPNEALYLLWNKDISGKSVLDSSLVYNLAHNLRSALAAVDNEFGIPENITDNNAREKMAMVYGKDIPDLFFSLINNSLVTRKPYSRTTAIGYLTAVNYQHGEPALEQEIIDAGAGSLSYDNVRNLLSYNGILDIKGRDLIKAAGSSVISSPQEIDDFNTAVDELYTKNQEIIQACLEQEFVDIAMPGKIAYDNFTKQIIYIGDLTLSRRDALKAAGSSLFSTPPEINDFNAAVDALYSGCQEVTAPFFALYPTLEDLYAAYTNPANTDSIEKKRTDLLESLLAELRDQSKYQQALQVICAETKCDTRLADAILNDAAVLSSADNSSAPAIGDMVSAGLPGLSLQYFFSDTIPDPLPPKTDASYRKQEVILDYDGSITFLPTNPEPGNAISGIWSGYIEPKKNGFYNIRIETDPDASVEVRIGQSPVPGNKISGIWSNTGPVELHAGALYPLTISVQKVKSRLKVLWTTIGQGWEVIPSESLYPAHYVDQLRNTCTRFLKIVSLAAVLGLTPNETVHVATDSDYVIGGKSWFESLPVSGSADTTVSAALLKNFSGLLDYSAIKRTLSPDREALLDLIKNPMAETQECVSLLSTVTQWDAQSLERLLIWFKKTDIDGKADHQALQNIATFAKIYRAFTIVRAFGIPADALIAATTNSPDSGKVAAFQAALRARYSPTDWRDTIQPINNELRGQQRDALVAYILQWRFYSTDSTLQTIDTTEKLFEYFLMDVEMEPCMQTSRVRHALSSVQLFIERCLLNLEPSISSEFMDDDDRKRQWQWMKRYRVWEANRKVFLYPENWLEPELRDDQSPFFKEAMNELLQGDITEDAAATTLLNYLSKLNDVAKLEVCSMFHVDGDDENKPAIDHVIARTTGGNRKYYYRRNENGWSPWEQIKLEIEDKPVLPVVWKGRLLLFWLRILQESPTNIPPDIESDETEDSLTQIAKVSMNILTRQEAQFSQVPVKAILCWSEYFNGKWQETRTSDTAKPLTIDKIAINTFNRSKYGLCSVEFPDPDPKLMIMILGSDSREPHFIFRNTHCVARTHESLFETDVIQDFYRDIDQEPLITSTKQQLNGTDINSGNPFTILTKIVTEEPNVVKPLQNNVKDPQCAPFFLQDQRYITYVHTDKTEADLSSISEVGVMMGHCVEFQPDIPDIFVEIPDQVIRPGPEMSAAITKKPVINPPDPAAIQQFVRVSENIRVGMNMMGGVTYSDTAAVSPEEVKTVIGPEGQLKRSEKAKRNICKSGGGIHGQ